MKAVTLLGATGSIGVSTLDVLARHPDKYRIYALTANRSVDTLFAQCRQFEPEIAVMLDAQSAERLAKQLKVAGIQTQVLAGAQALEQVAASQKVDYVVAAIVGAAGLLPTLAAARAGKHILLANKEALVMSGGLLCTKLKLMVPRCCPLIVNIMLFGSVYQSVIRKNIIMMARVLEKLF